MSHTCLSLLNDDVDAGVFEQYIRPSNVTICIFQKMELLKKIWSNFEIDLRPLKFSPKNLRPLIFFLRKFETLKRHSERVFPFNNVHPLIDWTSPCAGTWGIGILHENHGWSSLVHRSWEFFDEQVVRIHPCWASSHSQPTGCGSKEMVC